MQTFSRYSWKIVLDSQITFLSVLSQQMQNYLLSPFTCVQAASTMGLSPRASLLTDRTSPSVAMKPASLFRSSKFRYWQFILEIPNGFSAGWVLPPLELEEFLGGSGVTTGGIVGGNFTFRGLLGNSLKSISSNKKAWALENSPTDSQYFLALVSQWIIVWSVPLGYLRRIACKTVAFSTSEWILLEQSAKMAALSLAFTSMTESVQSVFLPATHASPCSWQPDLHSEQSKPLSCLRQLSTSNMQFPLNKCDPSGQEAHFLEFNNVFKQHWAPAPGRNIRVANKSRKMVQLLIFIPFNYYILKTILTSPHDVILLKPRLIRTPKTALLPIHLLKII